MSRANRRTMPFGRAAMAGGATLGLAGCQEGVLAPRGPIGRDELQILIETLSAMLLVVVPVIVLTLVFAWWFRASNKRAVYRPTWDYSGKIEFSIWMIPFLVVAFLGVLAWSGSHDLDPYRPIKSERAPVRVQVVSLDWKWLFIYPDLGIASINELALPTATPVNFQLTSATVMNSFFVPQLGSQIYTMAGMQTRLSLQADHPGVYRGLSAQFSGDGFSDMHFRVIATDAAGFDRWVAQVRQAQTTLDLPTYQALAHKQAISPVSRYGSVAPDLFSAVLHAGSAHPAPTPPAPAAPTSPM